MPKAYRIRAGRRTNEERQLGPKCPATDLDPISLQEFGSLPQERLVRLQVDVGDDKRVFRCFDVKTLVDWFRVSGTYKNPETGQPFSEAQIAKILRKAQKVIPVRVNPMTLQVPGMPEGTTLGSLMIRRNFSRVLGELGTTGLLGPAVEQFLRTRIRPVQMRQFATNLRQALSLYMVYGDDALRLYLDFLHFQQFPDDDLPTVTPADVLTHEDVLAAFQRIRQTER